MTTPHWTVRPWVGFDTETTGVDVTTSHILTASLVDYQPADATVGTVDNTIINPGVPIPETSVKVHGLTQQFIDEHGVDPRKGLEGIVTGIVDAIDHHKVLVAFNAGFDFAILEHNLVRLGMPGLSQRVDLSQALIVDPLVCDRALWKYRRGKRQLINLVDVYGIDTDTQHLHDAQADTTATLAVLRAMVGHFPQLTTLDDAAMMAFQRDQYQQWAQGFRAYMTSRGRHVDVSDTWIDVEGLH